MTGYAIFLGTLIIGGGLVYLARNLIFGYPPSDEKHPPAE